MRGAHFGGLLNAHLSFFCSIYFSADSYKSFPTSWGQGTSRLSFLESHSLCFWNDSTGLDHYFPESGLHTICDSSGDTGQGDIEIRHKIIFNYFSKFLPILSDFVFF